MNTKEEIEKINEQIRDIYEELDTIYEKLLYLEDLIKTKSMFEIPDYD